MATSRKLVVSGRDVGGRRIRMTGVQADVERKRVVAGRVESEQVSEQTRMSSGRETADGTTNKQQEVRSEESLQD